MRVTANTFPNSLVEQLNQLSRRQNSLQTNAATGQRVRLPEDDPSAARRLIDLQAQSQTVEQYRRNIDHHQDLSKVSLQSIQALKRLSDRASEIALQSDSLKSPEQLAIFATELSNLIDQGIQLANSKFGQDYLFAGTRATQPPFTALRDASGKVTSVQYSGTSNTPESEIAAGLRVSSAIPGSNVSGAGPSGLLADTRAGADLFAHLIQLRDHLEAGDIASIHAADIPALRADENNLLLQLSASASLQARLEATRSLSGQRIDTLRSQISKEADADLAETLVRLSQTQNAYQAALQSAGSILNQSLLQYLR